MKASLEKNRLISKDPPWQIATLKQKGISKGSQAHDFRWVVQLLGHQ